MSTSSDAAAEARHDRLGVGPRRRRRGAVRHQHAEQPFRADGLGHQVRDERRVDAAGQAEDGALEPGLAQLAADELADDAAGDVRVDGQLLRQLERRRRRRGDGAGRDRSPVGAGRSRRRSPFDPNPIGRGRGRSGATSSPASASGSPVRSEIRPARSATIRDISRTCSSGRSSRSSGSAIRSRRMSPGAIVTEYSPSS